MRTSSMVMASVLLLLLLLATRAHGIRLDRQLNGALSNKQEPAGDSKAAGQPSELAADLASSKHCAPDGRCSDIAGKQAKKAPAPAHAAAHQPIPGGKEEEAAPSRVLPRQEATTTTYPDILDIAGMDYTPAARKPPIHN